MIKMQVLNTGAFCLAYFFYFCCRCFAVQVWHLLWALSFFIYLICSSSSHRGLSSATGDQTGWTSEFVHRKMPLPSFKQPRNCCGCEVFAVSRFHPSTEYLWANQRRARCYVSTTYSLPLAWTLSDWGTKTAALTIVERAVGEPNGGKGRWGKDIKTCLVERTTDTFNVNWVSFGVNWQSVSIIVNHDDPTEN